MLVQAQHTADEEGIAGEYGLVVSILHEKAHTVLRVTGCVNTLDVDVTNLESFSVLGCFGNTFTVLAANNRQIGVIKLSKLLSVSTTVQVIEIALLTSFLLPPAWSQWLHKVSTVDDINECSLTDGYLR